MKTLFDEVPPNLYRITISYDGELFVTRDILDLFDAVDTWNKCVDSGDAKEYATYNFLTPTGKLYTKVFYVNGEVVVR
jgi:hypothetical protein